MKKIISAVMAVILFGATLIVPSFAKADDNMLKADENGNFKILQVADVQEHATADGKKNIRHRTLSTIKLAVATLKPDLIVLTGDNIHRTDSLADFECSVKQLTDTFKGTPFAVTYGNHDLERNLDNNEYLTYKQEQEIYDKYGAVKLNQTGLECSDTSDYSTSKYGTGYLDIFSADGTKVVNRVILVNSGTYEVDAARSDGYVNNTGKEGYGRTGVNAKTYKNTDYDNVVKAVSKWTDEGIKCIAYQHIALQEMMTSGILVEGTKNDVPMNSRPCEKFAGKYYKNSVKNTITNQYVEACGCSYFSTEELYKAYAKSGNTLGVFYGHEHTNTVMGEGTCYGLKMIQGYGGGMLVYRSSYGEDSPKANGNPMVCLYTINESNFTKETRTYSSLLCDFIFKGYLFAYLKDAIINIFK